MFEGQGIKANQNEQEDVNKKEVLKNNIQKKFIQSEAPLGDQVQVCQSFNKVSERQLELILKKFKLAEQIDLDFLNCNAFEIIRFLTELNLIPKPKCNGCDSKMILGNNKTYLHKKVWRCYSFGCNLKKIKLIAGNPFLKECRNVDFSLTFLAVFYYILSQVPLKIIMNTLDISYQVLFKLKKFWFQCLTSFFIKLYETFEPLGSQGQCVEIDESCFHRKYHRGRATASTQQWIFGLTERNQGFKRIVLIPISNSKKELLEPRIQKFVSTKSKLIVTDEWVSYGEIIHTQNIENRWTHIKNRLRLIKGKRFDFLCDIVRLHIHVPLMKSFQIDDLYNQNTLYIYNKSRGILKQQNKKKNSQASERNQMNTNQQILQSNRNSVVAFKKASYTTKQTQGELENLGISYSTRQINRIWRSYENGEGFIIQESQAGRPKKYTDEDVKTVLDTVNANPELSLRRMEKVEEVKEIGIKKDTIRKILIENEIQAYKIPKILPLYQKQRDERIGFAKMLLKKGKKYIKRICFSDETLFQMDKFGPQYAWVEKPDDIKPEMCIKKKSFPLRVHCWALISSTGPISFVKLESYQTSDTYINLLADELSQEFYNGDLILQQDNARCHISQKTMEWLDQNEIITLSFPPYSPDLSVIENIFGVLKREVYDIRNEIENEEILFSKLRLIFFNSELIKKSIISAYASYHERLNYLLTSNGDQVTI
ncbi:hypothetical protein ABPG72_016999 [Tetrahymena utriculariae]